MVLTARVPPSTKLGTPIPLIVVLRNERDELIELLHGREDRPFSVVVFNASGERVPWRNERENPDNWTFFHLDYSRVGPGQELRDEYTNLAGPFALDRPGEYTLCVYCGTDEFTDDEQFINLSVEGLKFTICE